MRAYIALLGRSTWATINAYYASLERGYLPDEVYLLLERIHANKLKKALAAFKILSHEYGIDPYISYKIIEEGDCVGAANYVRTLIHGLKEERKEVALEITSGRKAIVVPSVVSAVSSGADHVFYLALRTLEDSSKPYMMIPLHRQSLKDFVGELCNGRKNM